jgi:glycosyltransferase involved in cell wall biosynthesis
MQKNRPAQPLVSAIIPTYNSDRFLDKCLESLKTQTWKNLEVIVADDGSTDKTLEIAQKYRCNVARNPKKGRAEAKNEGMRLSSGEYLMFIDSDMELTSNVVSECIELANNDPNVGGIVIPELSLGSSFWVKARDFERSFYFGSIVESARFFPAKLAKEVGGFEENLVFFEESTLPYKVQRKGYNVFARVKSPIFHHEENFSLFPWLVKKFYYGKTLQTYRGKYGDYSTNQIGILFRLGLFREDRRRFWSGHELAFGVVVLKSLEYSAMALGAVYSKLKS